MLSMGGQASVHKEQVHRRNCSLKRWSVQRTLMPIYLVALRAVGRADGGHLWEYKDRGAEGLAFGAMSEGQGWETWVQ